MKKNTDKKQTQRSTISLIIFNELTKIEKKIQPPSWSKCYKKKIPIPESYLRKDQFIAYRFKNIYKSFIEEGSNTCAFSIYVYDMYVSTWCVGVCGVYVCVNLNL